MQSEQVPQHRSKPDRSSAIPPADGGAYPRRDGNHVQPLIDGAPAFRRICEAVEKIAAWAAASGVRVDAIRHSGKLRAEQTAKILAAALQPGGHPQVVPAQASTSWNASTSNERMTSTSLSMAASPMIPSCSSSR